MEQPKILKSFTSLEVIFLTLALASVLPCTDAFGIHNTLIKKHVFTPSPSVYVPACQTRQCLVLRAEEGDGSAEEVQEVEDKTEQEIETESVDEEEEEVDPEVKSLKDEIAKLESTLKQKNRDLNQLQNLAEDYSKNGYARKVAEVEQFRRLRSAASKTNTLVLMASVLQSFLPILDELKYLEGKYSDDEFAKKYSALSWDFNNAMKALGVTEFTAKEGVKLNALRENPVKEDYSDDIEKGFVIAPVGVGFELDGNVMRMADVVVSLGSEADAKAAAEKEKEEEEKDIESNENAEDEEGETANVEDK